MKMKKKEAGNGTFLELIIKWTSIAKVSAIACPPPFMFVKAFAIAKQLKMAPKAQNRKLHPWDWLEVFMA